MTVKLLVDRPIDGQDYKAGELCDTNDNTEAGLIASKLAVADLTGGVVHVAPVAQKQYVPVLGTMNPVTGKVDLSAGGVPVKIGGALPKTSVLKKCIHGYTPPAVAVVTNPYSMLGIVALEAPFDSVRLGILNASASSVAGVVATVCAGSTLGGGADATPTQIGLNVADGGAPFGRIKTWATAQTLTLAAAPVASGVTGGVDLGGPDCSVTWTNSFGCPSVDRADGGTLPLLFYTISWPAGTSRTYIETDTAPSSGIAQGATRNTDGDAATAPYGRVHRCVVQATKDGATTTGWWTTGVLQARDYRQFPPVIIEYTLRGGVVGRQLVVFDDSTGHINNDGAANMAYAEEFQAISSTPAAPIEVANFSIASSVMSMWLKKMNAMLPSFSNSVIMVKSWSPNDALVSQPTLGNMYDGRIASGYLASAVAATPTNVLMRKTMDPVNVSAKPYATADVNRVTVNNLLRASGQLMLDSDSVMTSAVVDANGQYTIKSGYADGGGIHYSVAGHKAIAAVLAATWASNT